MFRTRLPGAVRSLTVLLCLSIVSIYAPRAARAADHPAPELATAVVVGTVTSSRCLWIEGRLMTLAEVSVEERLEGTTPDEIGVLIAGGVDMSRRIPIAAVVPGQPRLDVGQRTRLYLRAIEDPSSSALHPSLYVVLAGGEPR